MAPRSSAKTDRPIKAGKVEARRPVRLRTPSSGVRRYILTSAQNNTPIYKDCWYNLRAAIYRGVFQAGTSSLLDLGYNKGPSSWSHSHVITYPEATRCVVTMWNGRWRA